MSLPSRPSIDYFFVEFLVIEFNFFLFIVLYLLLIIRRQLHELEVEISYLKNELNCKNATIDQLENKVAA